MRRAAAALGARILPLSTLRLAALDAGVALAAALACDLIVFTSPASVRFAARQPPLRSRPGQRWLAVGAGTAAALRRSGVRDVVAPDGRADSESLLALPALEHVAGRDIGLITAPGGRGVIAETLAHRGARLHLAPVYRREAAPPRRDRLRAALDAPAQSPIRR